MLSGALQAAITTTLDGHHGLAGWRWLFVVDGVITVVWGLAGLFMMPDLPNRPNPRAFWFKPADAELAMARLERHGRVEPKKVTWVGAKRTFSSWLAYLVPVLYIATVLGSYGNVYFALFLQALKNPDGTARWNTAQVNAIPIGGSAINVIFVWIWALLSDFFRTRWILIIIQALVAMICAIVMSIWTASPASLDVSAAYACYFITYMCLGTAPLIFSWLSDLVPEDPEARSLIVGVAIASYYAITAWSQVLVWPASQAPYYKYGWQSSIALLVIVLVVTCVLRFLEGRHYFPKRLAVLGVVGEAVRVVDSGSSRAEGNDNEEQWNACGKE